MYHIAVCPERNERCCIDVIGNDIDGNPWLMLIERRLDDDKNGQCWKILFLKQLGMCPGMMKLSANDDKYSFSEVDLHAELPLATNGAMCKALIHVLGMCMVYGNICFPTRQTFISPYSDGNFKCFNAILCAARLRAGVLARRCKGVVDAMRFYRFRHAQAKKIQRAWRRSISDPSYKLCRDRLMREYQDCTEQKS